MREKTGFYDCTGKNVCDGDYIKAIMDGQIIYGTVEDFGGWIMKRPTWSPWLEDLDEIEILKRVDDDE